jgi:hypothetical protein
MDPLEVCGFGCDEAWPALRQSAQEFTSFTARAIDINSVDIPLARKGSTMC